MKQNERWIERDSWFRAAVLTVLVLCVLFGRSVDVQADTLATPGGVSLSVSGSTVTFSWEEVSGISEYQVQVARDGDWDNPVYDESVLDTSISFSYYDKGSAYTTASAWDELYMGEKYSFRVRAVDSWYGWTTDELGDLFYDYQEEHSEWSSVESTLLAYEAPTVTSVKSAGAQAVTITWEAVSGAQAYRIYRSASKNGTYTKVKTVTDSTSDTLSYTDKKVTTGVKYYYKVRVYTDYFTYPSGTLSVAKGATPKPAKVTTLKAAAASYTSIQLTWSKGETGVDGYRIYRSTSKNGTYKKVKTISSRTTTTWTQKKLTIGKTYYYKMKAYTVVNGKTYYSTVSKAVSAKPAVTAPTIKSIKVASETTAKLTWSKVSGASGYIIYRSSTKNGTYKKVGTVKSGSTVTYTAKGLTNGKTYYFKVKAYRTVNGKNYKGAASAAKSRLMDKLAYEGESYTSRCDRIWGAEYYQDYASESAASKDMKTISIKVWDINSSGKKYAKTMYLTVHKNIASTVKAIFNEIYHGDEKFPIHDVGGYSWRGASSSSEHCEGLAIDINSDENAMINLETGTILSGSFYKPGTNAYSIPADGDVVEAFEKYGFYWGIWGSRADYMHFSYFGT